MDQQLTHTIRSHSAHSSHVVWDLSLLSGIGTAAEVIHLSEIFSPVRATRAGAAEPRQAGPPRMRTLERLRALRVRSQADGSAPHRHQAYFWTPAKGGRQKGRCRWQWASSTNNNSARPVHATARARAITTSRTASGGVRARACPSLSTLANTLACSCSAAVYKMNWRIAEQVRTSTPLHRLHRRDYSGTLVRRTHLGANVCSKAPHRKIPVSGQLA